jgi:hypothetical protein
MNHMMKTLLVMESLIVVMIGSSGNGMQNHDIKMLAHCILNILSQECNDIIQPLYFYGKVWRQKLQPAKRWERVTKPLKFFTYSLTPQIFITNENDWFELKFLYQGFMLI